MSLTESRQNPGKDLPRAIEGNDFGNPILSKIAHNFPSGRPHIADSPTKAGPKNARPEFSSADLGLFGEPAVPGQLSGQSGKQNQPANDSNKYASDFAFGKGIYVHCRRRASSASSPMVRGRWFRSLCLYGAISFRFDAGIRPPRSHPIVFIATVSVLDFRLFLQDQIQQGTVHCDLAVVIDEPQFAELVHEKAHA